MEFLTQQYDDDLSQQSGGEEPMIAETPNNSSFPVCGAGPKALAKKPLFGAGPKAIARKPTDGMAGLQISALPLVNAAPEVDMLGTSRGQNLAISTLEKRILINPTVEIMHKPLLGPTLPGEQSLNEQLYNSKVGHVEKANVNSLAFDKEYLTFHNLGYAANPCRETRGREVLISKEQEPKMQQSIWDKNTTMAAAKRRRVAEGADEDAVEDSSGIPHDECAKKAAEQWGGFQDSETIRQQVEDDVRLREEEAARQREEERAVEGEERETKERVTSVFHGTRETDYQGRSWMDSKCVQAKDVDEKSCFLPKKWLHTWSGHTMGVNQIRWFPNTAHLILSASMDNTVKIWDYQNQRKCIRTYTGHDQGVRDINFTTDGRHFYSVSYDKNIQYWDTETGQVVTTLTNKKTNFSVAVHPDPAQQTTIICGCSNKKAVQWDVNSGQIVQEYDEHMGAVNTVTFCEDGKRILTTSDDKKIYMWEFGIPVVVKYIAEPSMHSVPAVCLSPDKKYLLGQSMDNKIICYEAFGRYKFQPRRQFKGHLNAGYAITPGWSADARWIMSGDLDGKLWFWDWAKQKNFRVIKAHDGVCMSCIWHPTQASRVVSCGWDGTIKLWD